MDRQFQDLYRKVWLCHGSNLRIFQLKLTNYQVRIKHLGLTRRYLESQFNGLEQLVNRELAEVCIQVSVAPSSEDLFRYHQENTVLKQLHISLLSLQQVSSELAEDLYRILKTRRQIDVYHNMIFREGISLEDQFSDSFQDYMDEIITVIHGAISKSVSNEKKRSTQDIGENCVNY